MVRGWGLRKDSFHHSLAGYLREVAEQAAAAQVTSAAGRPLLDLAAYVSSQSTWNQELVALEALTRFFQHLGQEGFRPPAGSEVARTVAAMAGKAGAPQPHELLAEVLVAAAFDAEQLTGRLVTDEAERHARTKAELKRAERRILQLEGVESSLAKAKSRVTEVEQENCQQAKLIAHSKALVPAEVPV